jgi:hypothetical protein
MIEHAKVSLPGGVHLRRAACGAALMLLLPACGGAAATGAAAGKVGRDVSAHADTVPQGAEVCALKDALATQAAGPDKPMSDTCGKALKSDQLWQRAMIVLGAYADTLDKTASGADADTVGPLEAALTGVRGSDWIEVDEGPEKAAREAVAQIVNQLATNTAKGDLEKAVKDAAPHVKTLCGGLGPYLDTQARALADIQKEIDKKRTTRNDRRCGTLDTRSVCVAESVIDRMVYANAYGRLAALQSSHEEASRAVGGFCTMHIKLEDAANSGDLSKTQTYLNIVEGVKASRRAQPQEAADASGKTPAKK